MVTQSGNAIVHNLLFTFLAYAWITYQPKRFDQLVAQGEVRSRPNKRTQTYNKKLSLLVFMTVPPEGLPPYMGCIGMCHLRGYGFQPFRSEIGYGFWPFWCQIGYGFCTLVLNWVWFLEETTFSQLSIRSLTKALHNAFNTSI